MIPNALLFTILVLLGYGFWLLGQLKFMAAYRTVLFHAYSGPILLFVAALSVNLFGLALGLGRRFFLKNTGRKLHHLDRQFHVGDGDMPLPSTDDGAK